MLCAFIWPLETSIIHWKRILTLFSKAIIYQHGYGRTHSTLPFVPKNKKIYCRSVLSQLLSNKQCFNLHNLKIMEHGIISSKGLNKTYPKRTNRLQPQTCLQSSSYFPLVFLSPKVPRLITGHHLMQTVRSAICSLSLTFSIHSSSENLLNLLKRKWFKIVQTFACSIKPYL